MFASIDAKKPGALTRSTIQMKIGKGEAPLTAEREKYKFVLSLANMPVLETPPPGEGLL